jgi:hypothetical protein
MVLRPAIVSALCLLLAASGMAAVEQSKKGKQSFLIFGTVFTEKGFSLPGAEVLVRRTGEKKVRGEAASDRRGEFAVRVEPGYEYEVSVKARGFVEAKQIVDGRTANRQDLLFRMKPEEGGKKP